MNYIVFDLEWNQSPAGKKYANSKIPFEIIEIGAVKLNEERKIVDRFQCLIKPQVYNWIHENIHEVIHVNYRDLRRGKTFSQAVEEFFKWCGEEYAFFTWGNQDLTELQRNMKFYNILELLPGPVKYYDLQKIASNYYDDGTLRRALEYMVDKCGIEKKKGFHRALSDAYYTAEILKKLDMNYVFTNYSVDVFQNPKSKKEELYLSYPTYDKFISREFVSKEAIMSDREVISTRCPVCKLAAKRKIRWFISNSKIYYSISSCPEHGYIEGKIRIRKTEDEKYYAMKYLRCVDIEEAGEIRQKREAIRMKRQQKKNVNK